MTTNPSCIKLLMDLIIDKREHTLFELHEKYRFTPIEARDAVKTLEDMNILTVIDSRTFQLSNNIENENIKSLYKIISHRKIYLDFEEIKKYKDLAIDKNALYLPNIKIIDKSLIIS